MRHPVGWVRYSGLLSNSVPEVIGMSISRYYVYLNNVLFATNLDNIVKFENFTPVCCFLRWYLDLGREKQGSI